MSIQLVAKGGIRKGASWPIGADPVIIGRDQSCTITIADPSVSRRHCEIRSLGDGLVLRDLGSRNTTLVNSLVVHECVLLPGDEVAIGSFKFLVADDEMNPPPLASDLPAQATVTLTESDAIYLAGHESLEATVDISHTVTDLAQLFRAGRKLSRAESAMEMVAVLEQAVVTRYAPALCWTGIVGSVREDGSYSLTWSNDSSDATPPHAGLQRALRDLRGYLTLKRKQTGSEITMVAPIHFGDQRIGVVALRNPISQGSYDESDLHFLVALAHTAAPFFGAIAQRQHLKKRLGHMQAAQERSHALLGSSRVMEEVRQRIRSAAESTQPVLILGETGTGKELAAHLLHALSERAAMPMVTVNCAAIPQDLFESELFGYEAGAFTGAARRKPGLIEQAAGGTLFLDEIGDLSQENQARILRVIEDRRFRRFGGTREIHADFRVIAATNKNLPEAMSNGTFRDDLYYRIHGLELRMAPLREHLGDIEELALHFLEQCRLKAKHPVREFAPDVLPYLRSRSWPGNVWELEQTIEAAVAASVGNTITRSQLQAAEAAPCDLARREAATPGNEPRSLADVERDHVLATLAQCEGDVAAAATNLGISEAMLAEKLTQYRKDCE